MEVRANDMANPNASMRRLSYAMVALVMGPDKVTYRVRPGVYLGQSDGRVTSVREDGIELIELVPDGAGGWLERPASLALDDR